MKRVLENLSEFLTNRNAPNKQGIYAGNGHGFWVKCTSIDVANNSGETYIITVGQSDGSIESMQLEQA